MIHLLVIVLLVIVRWFVAFVASNDHPRANAAMNKRTTGTLSDARREHSPRQRPPSRVAGAFAHHKVHVLKLTSRFKPLDVSDSMSTPQACV